MKLKIIAVLALVVMIASPSAFAERNITVKGSDTLVVLGQRWAEEYMKQNPEVSIQVTGGGSGTGIAALINGTTDVANASRGIKGKEITKAKKNGYYPEEFKVAMDSLAVVLHKDNPIDSLSMKELMGIYTGRINNWKEVGGEDKPILRYCREANSGTYVFFNETVLKKQDYAADCQTVPGTSAVANAVSKDTAGIGYGGVAYFLTQSNTKVVAVSKTQETEAVSPVKSNGKVDYEAATSGKYPIARYLFMYTALKPKGEINEYLQWILSPDGQKIVEMVGYVPLTS